MCEILESYPNPSYMQPVYCCPVAISLQGLDLHSEKLLQLGHAVNCSIRSVQGYYSFDPLLCHQKLLIPGIRTYNLELRLSLNL